MSDSQGGCDCWTCGGFSLDGPPCGGCCSCIGGCVYDMYDGDDRCMECVVPGAGPCSYPECSTRGPRQRREVYIGDCACGGADADHADNDDEWEWQ